MNQNSFAIRNWERLLRILLPIACIFVLSVGVSADSPWSPWSKPSTGLISSGHCGKNVQWELFSDGTMWISGSGDMYDYTAITPWDDYEGKIGRVMVDLGVTSVGQGAFYGFSHIIKLYFSPSVRIIENRAFQSCTSVQSIVFTGDMPLLVYPFEGIKGTVYYPNSWSEIPLPGDYGLNSKWVSYSVTELPERYRNYKAPQETTDPSQHTGFIPSDSTESGSTETGSTPSIDDSSGSVSSDTSSEDSTSGSLVPDNQVSGSVVPATNSSVADIPSNTSNTTNTSIGSPVPSKKAEFTVSNSKVKFRKKTIIKIISNSGAKLTVKAKSKNAKNKKYVKISSGKTAKLTFTKKAAKGVYNFTVTSPANGNYKKTSKTIKIRVK